MTLAPVVALATHRSEVERLVRENRDFALRVAHKLVRHSDDWPSFESAALEALWQAARRYRPDCGATFPTWARYRIAGAVRDVQRSKDDLSRHYRAQEARAELNERSAAVARRQRAVRRPLSLDVLTGDGLSAHEVVASPEPDPLDDIDLRQIVASAHLTGRQLEAITRHLDGQSVHQIAHDLGTTVAVVYQHFYQAKKHLQRAARRAGLLVGGDAA